MSILGKSAAAIALLGLFLGGSGCDDDEDVDTKPLLIVQVAREQPGTDELGIIVVIQSQGGAWLEVEVSGGALAGGKPAVCLPAPAAALLRDSRSDVLVFPDLIESVVTVRLMPDATPVAEGAAGAREPTSAPGSLGPCRIDARALAQAIKPVRRVTPTPPVPSGGSGSVAASGGTGAAGRGVGPIGGVGGEAGTDGQPDGGGAGSPIGGATDGGQGGAPGAGGL